MINQHYSEFEKIVGKRCWGVVAGTGTGSMATIHIGEQTRRKKPISKNNNLPELFREFVGEYIIHIKLCKWQLNDGAKVICTSDDAPQQIHDTLNLLCGSSVTTIQLSESADIAFEFNKHYCLQLFCGPADSSEYRDCYSLKTPRGWISSAGQIAPDK